MSNIKGDIIDPYGTPLFILIIFFPSIESL